MNLRNVHLDEPLTAPATASVIEIARLLRDKKRRHIYLLDEKEFPIGIISITDINAKVVAEGKSPDGLVATDIMTTPLHMIDIENDIEKAYYEMVAHETLAVPVTDNGLLAGVLSLSEALRLMLRGDDGARR
jgi:CBS domain-containing protein